MATVKRSVSLLGACAASLALASPALATFPGENGAIAFSRDGDIWTVNPDGTGEKRLTSGPAKDTAPEWSPDGRELMFERNANVYRMKADGSGQTWVVAGRNPQFSGDGTRIAYDNGGPALIIANRDGSNPVQLHDDNTPQDWSPTNDLIIATQHELYTAMWITSEHGAHLDAFPDLSDPEKALTLQGGAWAPDGQRLALTVEWSLVSPCYPDCATTPNPDLGINVVGIDGKRSTIRPTGFIPAFSPDGRRIAFVEGGLIKLMDADGKNAKTLTTGTDPDWQPLARKAPPAPPGQTVTVHVPVQVPGPERVVEKVVTRTIQAEAPRCWIPSGKSQFTLTLRATRAIKKGAVVKVRVGANGKAVILKQRGSGLKLAKVR